MITAWIIATVVTLEVYGWIVGRYELRAFRKSREEALDRFEKTHGYRPQ